MWRRLFHAITLGTTYLLHVAALDCQDCSIIFLAILEDISNRTSMILAAQQTTKLINGRKRMREPSSFPINDSYISARSTLRICLCSALAIDISVLIVIKGLYVFDSVRRSFSVRFVLRLYVTFPISLLSCFTRKFRKRRKILLKKNL